MLTNTKLAIKRKLMPFVASIPIIALLLTGFSPKAQAVSFDQQLNQRAKMANMQVLEQKQQAVHQALGLSETVAQLETKRAKLENRIDQTAQQVAELKQAVVQAQKDLTKQREQMIANVGTSSDQRKVAAAAYRMNKLTEQLADTKRSISTMKADKKAAEVALNNARAESQRLLGISQDNRDAFEASVQANIDKLNQPQGNQAAPAETQDAQTVQTPETPVAKEEAPVPAAEPEPAPDPAAVAAAAESYPWADVPFPSDGVDPWGMFYRQCVSYTAWKVAHSGRYMPNWGGYGNANQWDDNAIAMGIPVDTTPRVGDVAVQNSGIYGHVMYVEAVNPDGTIYVSQMNYDLQGNYSEMTIGTAGLVFIHFP